MHSSKIWWLNAPNTPKRSTWLQSTIRELDEKTVSMLKMIEEDGDSFAQRVDMYYKKRPQLINMVEDLYRSHRSLAEKFYAAKVESRVIYYQKQIGWPIDSFNSKLDESSSATSFADIFEEDSLDDSDQHSMVSEVDDPELDDEMEMEVMDEVSSGSQEMIKLREETERLRRENQMQQEELKRKDEEKREVIRHLSLALDMVKEENKILKKSLAAKDSAATSKKWNFPELRKVLISSFMGLSGVQNPEGTLA